MTGARAAAVSTLVVAALVVLAAVALWPGGRDRPVGGRPNAAAVSDDELAPLRAAAALAPCPAPDRTPTGAQATGPLDRVTAACLGAPGTVELGRARPMLLNVWASWCGPCRAELPALAEYADRPGALPVLGVDTGDDPRAALRLLADLGVRFPSVSDPDGAVAAALGGPPALPLSYVVRADGSVTRVDPPVPFTSADGVTAAVERLR